MPASTVQITGKDGNSYGFLHEGLQWQNDGNELAASALQVVSLRRLSHPAIIKLREVIREDEELFFVFEYMVCCASVNKLSGAHP